MDQIDAVVAWVDGSDPAHVAKRKQWTHLKATLNSTQERRFSDNDELRYCLRSIRNFAPWIRNIWLVTDAQFPKSIDKSLAESFGIRAVDHRHIFRGFENVLPTFNSLSIESMIWRIEGLSEKFLYFNDDMILVGPISPQTFFREDKVILRGKWSTTTDGEKRPPHGHHKINAAILAGFDETKYFSPKHVTYPLFKSIMSGLYNQHKTEFVQNCSFKFRENSQFWPIALHDHYAISEGRAVIVKPFDVIHFSIAKCKQESPEKIRQMMLQLKEDNIVLTCLNYVEALKDKVPDVMNIVDEITQPRSPFEL